MRARTFALLLLMLSVATPAAAADADPLPRILKAHAGRLAEYAAWLKDQHLGSIALRVFEDALATDPDQDAARQALGWIEDGGAWKPINAGAIAGEGWADDGEANLAVAARREAALRAQHVKDCLDAAAALRGKKAPPEVIDRVLWAAVAADPEAVAARQALKHRENQGRWLAPEHEPLVAAMAAVAKAREEQRAAPIVVEPVESPWKRIPGWPGDVPKGARVGEEVALSFTDPAWSPEAAAWLDRTQRYVLQLLAPSAAAGAVKFLPYAWLHVSRRDAAYALIDERPGYTDAQRAAAREKSEWTLANIEGYLHFAASPAEWFDALVLSSTMGAILNVAGKDEGVDWLSRAVAFVATRRLLGTNLGWVSAANPTLGQAGAFLRRGESLDAFLRRMAATAADPPLAEVAGKDPSAHLPRDIAKAGSVLDWLFLRDTPKAQAFVLECQRTTGDGAAAVAAAEKGAKEAGFESLAAMDAAWRRFVIDVVPPPPPYTTAGGEPWKTTKLEKAKSLPDATSLYDPPIHPVVKYVLLSGRQFLCEVADNGRSVRLQGLVADVGPRTVSAPGVYPFDMAGEYGTGSVEVRLALSRDERGVWFMRGGDAPTGGVAGAALTFLDLDLDGHYGAFHHDGYVMEHGSFILPLRNEIVLGSKIVTIRRVGPDGKEVAWRARPLPVKGGDLNGLLRLNDWRTAAGVVAVAWDETEASGSQLHADYLARNFADGAPPADLYREDLAKPGATATGVIAAARAVVTTALTQTAAVDRWMGDLKARAALLDPAARRAAGGFSKNVAVLFLTGPDTGEPTETFRGPILFPPPNAEGVPTTMTRAGGSDAAAGYPISLHFPAGATPPATIALKTAAGAAVERAPADVEGAMPPGVVAFVPKSPLAAGAVYRVASTWESGGSRETREWTFRTGPK